MFKVKYINIEDVDNLWQFIIGKSYNCQMENDKFVVYNDIFPEFVKHITDITGTIRYGIIYTKDDFHKNFIDIKEDRRLKLKKIRKTE